MDERGRLRPEHLQLCEMVADEEKQSSLCHQFHAGGARGLYVRRAEGRELHADPRQQMREVRRGSQGSAQIQGRGGRMRRAEASHRLRASGLRSRGIQIQLTDCVKFCNICMQHILREYLLTFGMNRFLSAIA